MAGSEALPRRSGELVFHDDWERRAFALAIALCEQGHYSWNEFRDHLIASIGETPDRLGADAPGYYEHWLTSLETTLAEKGIVASGET